MPGVSIKTICAPGRLTIPRIRFRVVWGTAVTMETLAPTRALTRVLFPAFGRPTMATNPDLWESAFGMVWSFSWRWGKHFQTNLQHRPLIGFQHFKSESVLLHLLARGGNMTQLREHQASHRGIVLRLEI